MSISVRKIVVGAFAFAVLQACPIEEASAQYFRHRDSDLNPAVLQIDEQAVLGRAIDAQTELIDHAGRSFRWGEFAGKPTILVLAYYTCDGSCSTVNDNLHGLLKQMSRFKAGQDFNLVTLSFDRRDTLETSGAFRRHLDLADELAPVWTFATFKDENALKAQTEKIGFKFFWSPQDGLFLHPGVYLFFSPDGRLARILYQQDVDADDIKLALLDARQGQFKPGEVVNYALSLCYSYNYQDGKYRLSIPVFIAVGALASGVLMFAGSALAFRMRRQTQPRRA